MDAVAKISEVPNYGKKAVEVNGNPILIVNVKGEIFACENECPHQGSPLNAAIVKDGPTLSCPRHGYKFNLKTGVCLDYPEYNLKIYPVSIAGDDISVNVG